MSGRRSHPRFAVTAPWDGAVRVLRDVVVQRTGPLELMAVSTIAGLIDEEMSLDVVGGGASLGLKVRVVESMPVVFDGTVRHRLRLAVVGATPQPAGRANASGLDAVEI